LQNSKPFTSRCQQGAVQVQNSGVGGKPDLLKAILLFYSLLMNIVPDLFQLSTFCRPAFLLPFKKGI
jgi:hypothetical protein